MSATCGCVTSQCTCGCGDGIAIVTPQDEYNPPGQGVLHYRVGTHATFYETMLARLSNLVIDATSPQGTGMDRLYPLKALTARATSDPAIALLDCWAVIGDVLSFYQERIANEGYLATALERRSILELAELVGYRLRPGVASSVYLAFTAAAGFEGDIPAGTRAQSVPGPGERPQFFETGEALTARAQWNAMKPRRSRPQIISPVRDDVTDQPAVTDASVIDTVYFDGITTNLKTGSALIFVFDNSYGEQWMRLAETVTAQGDDKRTEIVLTQDFASLTADQIVQLYIDKAEYLFQGSRLAKDVAAVLDALRGNLDPDLVRLAVAQLHEKLSVAKARGFTRLVAWIRHIIQVLPSLAGKSQGLDDSEGGDGNGIPDPPTYDPNFAQSSFAASPLGNLTAIASSLALAPSLQPANAMQLNRSVALSYAPQSDIAARFLSAFKPAAAKTLYPAWRTVSKPYGWVQVHAARAKAGLFASRYPGAASVTVGSPPVFTAPTLATAWKALITGTAPPTALALDSTYDEIKPGSWIAIDRPRLANYQTVSGRVVTYHQVVSVRTASMDTTTGHTATVTLLTLNRNWLQDLPKDAQGNMEALSWLLGSVHVLRDTVVYAQSEPLALAEEPLDTEVGGDSLSLDGVYDGLEPGRWVIVSGNRTDVQNASCVKASELAMIAGVSQGSEAALCSVFPSDFTPFSEIFCTTPANPLGERLVVGAVTPDFFDQLKKLSKPGVLNQEYCSQIALAPGFYVNAYVPTLRERLGDFRDFTGLLVDPVSGKPVQRGRIPGINQKDGSDTLPTYFAWRISTPKLHTILNFASGLAYVYDRASVSVLGNVAKATHGQSTGEVLGDGSGALAFQSFTLHQSPITYLSAATEDGAQNSLSIRVNDIEWHEKNSLTFAGPRDRVFITEADDDDKMTVIFGNGERGLRVPSGTANIKATYRYGIGASGNVDAEQISQLATQPLGVQSVINPLAASGGADRDSAEEARANTPIAVMALDRLVSVKDYADFARAYAGIGKASAVKLSDGRRQFVHLTLAGARDIALDPNSDLVRNLLTALESYGDPSLPVALFPRRLKLLVMSAAVSLLPDYAWEAVEPVIRESLLRRYAFAAMSLGESVFLSEAVRVVQEVEGVSHVVFSTFDAVAEDATAATLAGLAGSLKRNPYVRSELARPNPDPAGDPPFLPAEMVVLTPAIPDTLILTKG